MNYFLNNDSVALVTGQQAVYLPPPPPKADPFAWEYWLPRWVARKATTTRKVYRDAIIPFLDFIGWKPIPTVQTTDIEEFQQVLVNRGHKPNTTARKIATVCSLLSYIHKRDLRVLPQNVGAGVERVKATNDLANRILSEAECLRMFDREPSLRNRALLRVIYSAGLRISEALGMKWGDVIWREKEATITVLGKGSKVRSVVIYGAAVEALQAILPEGEADASAYIFQTCHGQLQPIYAVEIIRNAAKRAGIRKAVSPHWLRHASATHALERGAPLPLVSRTLGHSNLATTGRYLHVRPGESMGRFHAV